MYRDKSRDLYGIYVTQLIYIIDSEHFTPLVYLYCLYNSK
ncbi:hypothetical protein [Salmonella phage SD-15_S21]|nr:hypothetical protein [Salmonella phage SD-15_S21]